MKNNGKKTSKLSLWFNWISGKVTRLAGRPVTSIIAFVVVLIWAVSGPLFGFSDTWQLVINTGTTIITFLMVFIIQQSQNKDTMAVQLKLNELIACNQRASNRLIVVEDLTEEELEVLKNFYIKLSSLAKKERDLHRSHSIDEASRYHQEKIKSKSQS
ncbi:MAG: low affinity iron permease family protein [Bacteroidota bacterium]|nr:low affinity iron permease family protein [Bacteroidota bacterium]